MSMVILVGMWVVGIMVTISILPLIMAMAQVLVLMVMAGMVWLFVSLICLVELIGVAWNNMIWKIKGLCK